MDTPRDPAADELVRELSRRLDEQGRELAGLHARVEALESGEDAPAAATTGALAAEDFLPYAERVEEQLRAVEERVERAGEVVRNLASRGEPAAPQSPADAGDPALERVNRISFEELASPASPSRKRLGCSPAATPRGASHRSASWTMSRASRPRRSSG
jgi:hypothetical protein